MASLSFSESGKEFTLSYRMMKELAQNFPQGEKYSALAADIISLGIPSLSSCIIEKADLLPETADVVWTNSNLCIRRQLLKKREFVRHLTDAQADDILCEHDALSLCHIAEWGHELFVNHKSKRISEQKALEVIEAAKDHPDWRPRAAVAANSSLPIQFCPDLSTQLDFQIPPESLRFECMTMADLGPLQYIVSNVLFYLTNKLYSVKDKNVRQAVLNFFVSNPDPGVRLIFAENAGKYGKCTPKMLDGLKKLGSDIEPDVAAAAQLSIRRQQRGAQ